MESKKQIYDLIPAAYYPQTIFIKANTPPSDITESIKLAGLRFPLVCKPDIGMKGMAVKKTETEHELAQYVAGSKVDFLVQEYISYPNEVGIFYYRYPNENRGQISGIVKKEFLTVTGDGVSTVEELLQKDKRHVLQIPMLKKSYAEKLNLILKMKEELLLVPYGNHVRGAKFTDDSNLIDEKLLDTIDSICKKIQGFYFGRMDVRFNTWEELRQGNNFSIIELNGAGSEPTHIYDPKHSIFFAWSEILKHNNILWRISRMNHHPEHRPYMSTALGLKMFRENSQYLKLISGK